MPKVLTIALASVLALGLVLGLALPGVAAPELGLPWADDFQVKIATGKVISVDEVNQQFVIKSGDKEVTISVDEETEYYRLGVPGRITALAQHLREFRHQAQERNEALARHRMRFQERLFQPDDTDVPKLEMKWFHPFGGEAEFSDITVGDRVVVWAEENSELLAEWVLISKVTTYASVSGTITGVSSSTITITPDDDGAVTLTYNESTVFTLNGFTAVAAGQYARAIYDSGNMLAKKVTVSLTGD